jgi:hypothetical protein
VQRLGASYLALSNIGLGFRFESGRFFVAFGIDFAIGRELLGRACSDFPQFPDLV